MNIGNLKITTKLSISAAVFLLPLGIMLFLVISMSLPVIEKNNRELQGINVLRPAVSLMQIIPQYVRFSVDRSSGDIDFAMEYTTDLFGELNDKYTEYFGDETFSVSPQALMENWEHLTNSGVRDSVLQTYSQLMTDLHRLIVFTGEISGLITDSDIESAYLVAATVHELPQSQERIVSIGNILRTAQRGAFTQERREELIRHLHLLVYSDNARIQNRFDSAESLRIRNTETLESFELLLKTCYDRIAYFSQAVENTLKEPVIDVEAFSAVYEAAGHANNATFMLQAASLDRLEGLIHTVCA